MSEEKTQRELQHELAKLVDELMESYIQDKGLHPVEALELTAGLAGGLIATILDGRNEGIEYKGYRDRLTMYFDKVKDEAIKYHEELYAKHEAEN